MATFFFSFCFASANAHTEFFSCLTRRLRDVTYLWHLCQVIENAQARRGEKKKIGVRSVEHPHTVETIEFSEASFFDGTDVGQTTAFRIQSNLVHSSVLQCLFFFPPAYMSAPFPMHISQTELQV